MRGLRSGRRAVGVMIGAAAALVLGSYLVVASATAAPGGLRAGDPAPSPTTSPAPSVAAAVTTIPVTSPLSVPAPAGTEATTPLVTVPPAPASSAPAATVPPVVSTTAPPPGTGAVPTTAVPSVAPRALVAPGAGHRHRGAGRHAGRGATTSAEPSSAQADRVAAQVVAALNLQGRRSGRVPATGNNVALLARWIMNEGGLWADNPLNTSLDAGRYPHQFTSGGEDTGIPIFPTMAAGVRATASTLLSNSAYGRILRLLRTGTSPCLSFARAVIASPWASSHYGYDTSRFCAGSVPAPTFRRK